MHYRTSWSNCSGILIKMPWRRLCAYLSAAGWITTTVCCTVSTIVHSAAARGVTGATKFSHISSLVLGELHQLPVRHWIMYKLATIIYKCKRALAFPYLVDDCVPIITVTSRHLPSADSRCHVVPRTKTVLGTCNFAVTGPCVWNSLPANICSASVSLQTCWKTKDILENEMKSAIIALQWFKVRSKTDLEPASLTHHANKSSRWAE